MNDALDLIDQAYRKLMKQTVDEHYGYVVFNPDSLFCYDQNGERHSLSSACVYQTRKDAEKVADRFPGTEVLPKELAVSHWYNRAAQELHKARTILQEVGV